MQAKTTDEKIPGYDCLTSAWILASYKSLLSILNKLGYFINDDMSQIWTQRPLNLINILETSTPTQSDNYGVYDS